MRTLLWLLPSLLLLSPASLGCQNEEDTAAFLQLLESFSIDGITYTENFQTIDVAGSRPVPLTLTLRDGVEHATIFWTVSSGTIAEPFAASTIWSAPGIPTGATLHLRVQGDRSGESGEQIITTTINVF